MKLKFTNGFKDKLNAQIEYIAKDRVGGLKEGNSLFYFFKEIN